MRLVNFLDQGKATLGVKIEGRVFDVASLDPKLPNELTALLKAGPAAMEALARAAAKAEARGGRAYDSLELLPPTSQAGKVLCLGVNYLDHAAESGFSKPVFPVIFPRFATSFVAQGKPIVRPRQSEQLDFEGELVAFIGSTCSNVSLENALSHVAGYSIFNDASIRDYQFLTPQWTIGKNFDGTGAFGPEFVTADELPPGAVGLLLETRLNGQVVQHANTREMVFSVADSISQLSQCMTLEAGDILIMGTPAGVGLGRKPPLWMKPGDVCEITIEKIGTLTNPIVQGG